MPALTHATELLVRHQDTLSNKRVVIAGDLQDFLPIRLEARSVKVHTTWYHHYQILVNTLGEQAVQFSSVADTELVGGCDTLIYYWPKNKLEALFQLTNLLSLLPLGCDVYVVGGNRSGVYSAEPMLSVWCPLVKIDSARRCKLYQGKLVQQPCFNVEAFWQSYQHEDVVIKTLPGVFSRDGLDDGSQLLLSTFNQPLHGHVANIGCGVGVLSAVLAKEAAGVQLTLSDAYAPALAASRATLLANGLQGKVLAGDVYSSISGHFDMIISNPPFHDGIQINLQAAEMLIRGALNHLRIYGELRIVANAFLPYAHLLNAVFGNYQVLAQNGRFKVYQAIHCVKHSCVKCRY
ncbi:16S rRNA (guanine(1207)-N(2))-methyltransferase RsmC [Candidatus Doolittlea endobia]|uniref:Ribosomal RNA small subunit methyltransferase C n=1 Tax=Candidatus Doolittlea endobia TaxID=1778262 RepID=A0A143WSE3_9ENTR|nr:16S rRNA (guanine(1207)-N(2))-methyltransferase RsmC [Candidatus Doolittlea endobia]CUX96638.1 Ribosomal RNA small subunit methyltransferase C [Candidatus Doolittlea endobia]